MQKKQISGGVILSFISQFISIIVGLLYTPIMIKSLGQNEYGLYQLVQSVVNYLNLMNFGFSGAYIRYFSIAKTKQDDDELSKVNGMFFDVFMFIALLCLAAGVVLFFNTSILGNHLTQSDIHTAKILLVIMIINMAISFPGSLFAIYMSANERFIVQKVVNIIMNLLVPLLTIPLLWAGFGSVGVVAVSFILTVVRLVINLVYCFKYLDMKIRWLFFDKVIFAELFGYTFFIFLSDLVDQLNSNVDKLLLGRIKGNIAVAIYSVGFNLKQYYTMMTWIVPEMFVPEVNRLVIEEKSDEKSTLLFTKIGRINNYIVLLVIAGFYILGKPFISLWVGNDYEISYYAALILMISGYIPAVQTLGVNIQNAKNMHSMRSVVYFIVACINIVLSVFLIQKYAVIGTCIGTLIAIILGHGFFMNFYYHKHIGLNIVYFWKEISKWFLPVIVITVLVKYISGYYIVDSWIRFFVLAIIFVVLYIIMLYLFGLNKSEKESCRRLCQSVILRKK